MVNYTSFKTVPHLCTQTANNRWLARPSLLHLEWKDGMQRCLMEFLYGVSNWSRKVWPILSQENEPLVISRLALG